MSQATPIIGANKTGLQYRSDDNDGKQALLNHHKGSTAPTYLEAGMVWIDDTATPWLMKTYDGADWIIIGSINATTNEFAPYVNGAVLGDASETAKGIVERLTDAEVATGTDTTRYPSINQIVNLEHTYSKPQIGAVVALTSTTNSTAVDMSLSNNFSTTLTENTTIANPTNMTVGQEGKITITQDAVTARTVAYGSYWDELSGAIPDVSTTLGTVNEIHYTIVSATQIFYKLITGGVA